MSIHQYLTEAEASRRYSFRMKTVVPMDDAALHAVERTLAKYMPDSIARPKKTPIQKEPIDFKGVQNAEVWIIDFVLSLPASAYVLQQDLRGALNIPDKYIMVRGDADPVEFEAMRINAENDIEEEALKLGLRPASLLDTEPSTDTNKQEELFGDEYNKGFTGFLRQVQLDRKGKEEVDAKAPLFKWIDMPGREDQEPVQTDLNFNDHLKDAPKLGNAKEAKLPKLGPYGDKDYEGSVIQKAYLDKNGKRVVLSRKIGIRGE